MVVFDYRGYGFSGGTADVAAFQRDGVAIYDALMKEPGRRVVVYGFCLGSSVAAYVAAHLPVAGLILAAPIATAPEELPVFANGPRRTRDTTAPRARRHRSRQFVSSWRRCEARERHFWDPMAALASRIDFWYGALHERPLYGDFGDVCHPRGSV